MLLTMGVGLVGALFGGVLFSLLGDGSSSLATGTFSLGALFVAFSAAVLLLAVVTLVRRGTERFS
jgi:uncharacterized membrane protein YeaQ/YmgE (transglycosylase-associated protein family)